METTHAKDEVTDAEEPKAATGSFSDAINSAVVPTMALQISVTSCSTQPGRGKCWVNSRYR